MNVVLKYFELFLLNCVTDTIQVTEGRLRVA